MRFFAVILIAALAACAASVNTPAPSNPLAAARGTALPPPSGVAGQSAPPEGVGPAGFEFGAWRGADPASYSPALQTRVRARYQNWEPARIKADLVANGFACEDGARLDCRIEIMERQCAHDWYVVVAPGREPVAGFDVMCLGAR